MSVFEECLKFVKESLEKRKETAEKGPLLVIVSGPQGSGKSYTSALLGKALESEGLHSTVLSIDDFYLTHADQLALQAKFPQNKLIQGRGLPGTHDLPLLKKVMETIVSNRTGSVEVPVYDKSKFNGQGDRAGTHEVALPLDCVIMEGWFLGFGSGQTASTDRMNPELTQVDQWLKEYASLLWESPHHPKVMIKFATDDIKNVYKWRLQQEHQLVKQQGQGMSDQEVIKFVDRYMPCYELYYSSFCDVSHSEKGTLIIHIDENRQVQGIDNKMQQQQ